MKKIRILALLLAVLLTASFAHAETTNDPIVVKAGATEIRLSVAQAYFDQEYEQSVQYLREYGVAMDEELLLMLRDNVISQLVQRAILDSKIEEYGLGDVSDAEKEAARKDTEEALTESINAYAEQMEITFDEAKAEYDRYGMTVESQYQLMVDYIPIARLYDKIVGDTQVTDEEIMAQYNSSVESDKSLYQEDIGSYELYTTFYGVDTLYVPEGYRLIKRIVLDVPAQLGAELSDYEQQMAALQDEIDSLGQALYVLENEAEDTQVTDPRSKEELTAEQEKKQTELEALQQQVEALRAQVLPEVQPIIDEINAKLAAGESFDTLIAEYSAENAQDIPADGYMVHADSIIYDEAFHNAAMGIAAKGELSVPTLGKDGIYLLQYADDAKSGPVPITDEMKESIRTEILASSKDTAFTQALADWTAEAKVETHPELIVLPEPNTQEFDPTEDEESVG